MLSLAQHPDYAQHLSVYAVSCTVFIYDKTRERPKGERCHRPDSLLLPVTSTAISHVNMSIGCKSLTNLCSEMIFLQGKPVFYMKFANFWLEIWSCNWRFFIDVFDAVFIVY
jgi:hypothetical protein